MKSVSLFALLELICSALKRERESLNEDSAKGQIVGLPVNVLS